MTQEEAAGPVASANRQAVGRTMVWLSVGTIAYLGAQWLLTVAVVRLLGQAANGDYTLALSGSAVAYAVVLFGMRPFQISDTRREFSDATYIASRFPSAALATAVFVVFLPFTADVGRLWPLLLLFLGFRLTEGFFDVLHGILQNADRARTVGIALLVRAVTELGVFVAVIWLRGSLVEAVGAMFLVSLVLLLVLERPAARAVADRRPLRDSGGWGRAGRLLVACAPLLVPNLAYALMTFVPRNAIGVVWGQAELGAYGAIAAPLLLVPVLVSYLYTPFMPLLAEHAVEGRAAELRRLAGLILLAILGLIGVSFLALPWVGPPALALMFGPDILDHLELLFPVAGSVACTALAYYGNAVLTAVRRVAWTMVAALAAVAVVLVGSSAWVAQVGANGASFILIAAQLVQVAVLALGFALASRSGARAA